MKFLTLNFLAIGRATDLENPLRNIVLNLLKVTNQETLVESRQIKFKPNKLFTKKF